VSKQSHANPVFFKADRFLSKEVFPNTWLNKPELNTYAKTACTHMRRSSNITPKVMPLAGSADWSKTQDLKRKAASSVVVNEDIVASPGKSPRLSNIELGPESGQYAPEVKIVNQDAI
jgi:hypothetical protein